MAVGRLNFFKSFFARMAELVDALVSGTSVRTYVQVRVLFRAPQASFQEAFFLPELPASSLLFLLLSSYSMPVDYLPEGCVKECRGCGHRLMTMQESLIRKKTFLQSKLSAWGDLIEDVRSVPASGRLGYRDKVNLAMKWTGTKWETGTLNREDLISIPDCPVHKQTVNEVIRLFHSALPGYSEIQAVRYVQTAKQVAIVVKSRELPDTGWLTETIAKRLASIGIEGVWLHLFPSSGKKVFGKGGWHLIRGKESSQDESGLWYGPAAFQQLLPVLANQALDTAYEFLMPDANSAVIEMYCGTGSGLKKWTQAGAKALGIEISAEALRMAAMNAPRAETFTGTCRQRLPQMEKWLNGIEDGFTRLLYVNPPRTGMEDSIAEWIASFMKPIRMAYLSCSAGTLSRDLSILCKSGYSVDRIIPFDFFPQTIHVESLVLLKKADCI